MFVTGGATISFLGFLPCIFHVQHNLCNVSGVQCRLMMIVTKAQTTQL
jgi:hypothetical protein